MGRKPKATNIPKRGKTAFRALVGLDVPGEEQKSSVFFAFPKRARHFNREGFATVFLAEIGRVAEDRTMLWQEFRVLLCIIRDLEYGNLWAASNYSEVARRIGMQRQNFNAIINRLAERNILIPIATSPNKSEEAANTSSPKTYRQEYRLNRRLAWRGKGEDYLPALKDEPQIVVVERENKRKRSGYEGSAKIEKHA